MVDKWGRPEFKDWMMLTQGIENLEDIKLKRQELNIKNADARYRFLSENATAALVGIDGSKNTDGTIKDLETWRANYKKLSSGYDQINTITDIVPDSYNWEDGTYQLYNHETEETKTVPMPKEDELKQIYGNYFEMKGKHAGQTPEGFKKFLSFWNATQTYTQEKNRDLRDRAEVYENDKGEVIHKAKQLDGKGTGHANTVYFRPETPNEYIPANEGEQIVVAGKYKSTSKTKEEAEIELKKAQKSLAETREKAVETGITGSEAEQLRNKMGSLAKELDLELKSNVPEGVYYDDDGNARRMEDPKEGPSPTDPAYDDSKERAVIMDKLKLYESIANENPTFTKYQVKQKYDQMEKERKPATPDKEPISEAAVKVKGGITPKPIVDKQPLTKAQKEALTGIVPGLTTAIKGTKAGVTAVGEAISGLAAAPEGGPSPAEMKRVADAEAEQKRLRGL